MSTTLKSTDIYILRFVIILIGIGTVSMYSASSIYAEYKYDDYLHYLTKQVIWLPIAVIGYFFSSRVNYYYFKNYIYYLVGFTWLVIFLAFMFNNTGMPSRYLIIAGKNWMTTSDLARIMLIIFTAYFIDLHNKNIKDTLFMIKNFSIVPGITLFLILMQPDLSSTFIISMIILAMLYVANASTKYIILVLTIGIFCGSIKILSTEYMYQRLDFWTSDSKIDTQQDKSLWALGNGGWIGKGPGKSQIKNGYLTAAHTDFILPIIGEEFGFLGILTIFILFILIFHYGISSLKIASNRFAMFLSLGIIFNIIFYFLINVSFVLGYIPNTGLAMPFVSYGGSNIIFTLFTVGLLLNIYREGLSNSSIKYRNFNG